MCGIVAVVTASDRIAPALESAIAPMTDRLRHRGPDEGSSRVFPHAVLGHRRLSIIGVSTGQQPMTNEDGTVWVIFNGEIYNHHDLRARLEAHGHVFRSTSDTEVIVHGFEQWGPRCVEQFEGMFAFVVHDTRTRTTFAARDRLGKKPLFHAMLDGHLHIASELKALQASPAWTGDVDEDFLDAYLALGYVPAPRTAYRGVSKLLPGHSLILDSHGLRIQRYWDVQDFDSDARDEADVVEALDAELTAAVRARLESEVPLGAFLSGGIDSGLVVSYMAEAMTSAPVTLTVGFSEDPRSELRAAQATADALHTNHHPHVVRAELGDLIDTLVDAFDEPFADSCAVSTYFACRSAREHVTVALSGDGGDETFAGYDLRYLPHMREESIRRATRSLFRAPSSLASRFWPRSRQLPRPLRLYNTLANLGGSEADAFYRDLCMLKPEDHAVLRRQPRLANYRASWTHALVRDAYERCPSPDALQRAQYADLCVYMPNDPLVKVDRMSMAHSLEVRAPLLDRKVVEFAFRLPASRKLPSARSKVLLRRLADRRLPPSVVDLPKKGFEAPVAVWLRGGEGLQFEEEVLRPGTWVTDRLSLPVLRATFAEHRSARVDHSYLLWASWMLHRWANRNRL